MRTRIHFSKTADMRFTGHLDLHKTWERTMRRAQLPLAYSQGFSPHPRINLASALPLGFTSQAEVVDVWLEQDLPLADVQAALERAIPPGIRIQGIESVDNRLPTLQGEVQASEFEITFLDLVADLPAQINILLSCEHLPRRRRGKDYDLRPLILNLKPLPTDADGHQRLRVTLSAREGATGRPEEVVTALGGDPAATLVHRTVLFFKS